jgi:hypothetical protein
MAEPQPSGRRSLAAVVLALAAVFGVVLLVVRAGRRAEPEAERTGPEMTTVMISSEPAGATVSSEDGGVLGVTPFSLTLPKRDFEMPTHVRLAGYQEKRVTVPLFSATGRVDIMMTRVGEKPPEPPKPPPDGWVP